MKEHVSVDSLHPAAQSVKDTVVLQPDTVAVVAADTVQKNIPSLNSLLRFLPGEKLWLIRWITIFRELRPLTQSKKERVWLKFP